MSQESLRGFRFSQINILKAIPLVQGTLNEGFCASSERRGRFANCLLDAGDVATSQRKAKSL